MVKSDEFTCNICKKMYSSNSSLWNHRTKKHKVILAVNSQPITAKITAICKSNTIITEDNIKLFNCRYCEKQYKHQQSRFKHELKCYEKNQLIPIQNNNNQLKQIQNTSIQTQNIGTINNGTINNGTINNTIVINNFNNDNINYISDEFMKRVLDRLSKNDDDSLKGAIPHLVENIKFNDNHKENNNVQITNIKSKVAKKYIENKWKYVKKDQMLKEMHNKAFEILQLWVQENKELLTKKMLDGLRDYKNVNPDYKKKVIHEEINLLGYNYYKNNMEDELDA